MTGDEAVALDPEPVSGYDGNGVRAAATFTPSGGSGTTQNFTWNTTGSNPQLLKDSTNAYIYGAGSAPIEQVNLGGGTTSYITATGSGPSAASSAPPAPDCDQAMTPRATPKPARSPPTHPFGYAGAYTDPTASNTSSTATTTPPPTNSPHPRPRRRLDTRA